MAGYIAEKGKIRQIFGLVPRSLTSELLAHFLYGWASLSFFVWKRAKTLKGGTKPASISHINTHQPCTISAGIAIRKPSSSATSHPTGSSTIHIHSCLPPLSGLWSLVWQSLFCTCALFTSLDPYAVSPSVACGMEKWKRLCSGVTNWRARKSEGREENPMQDRAGGEKNTFRFLKCCLLFSFSRLVQEGNCQGLRVTNT